MGGKSTQTQQSSTQPWAPAQPALNSILGQLQGLIPNSGLSSTSTDAINQLESNAQAGNPYSGQISSTVSNLLNGGGANAQAPALSNALSNYTAQTNPLASNTDYNPYNTPGFADALKTMGSDITNQVNGQFAAAGRDFSGANSQALSRGLAQGLSSTIANQYNQNVQNQQTAAGNQFSAGNTSAGLLSGLNQQGVSNQVQGITSANDALAAQNYTPTQLLQLESLKQSLPAQALGLLTQIGVPIAGLGTQSQGTATQQMSGAQQFGTIMSGIGALGNLWKASDRRIKEDVEQVGELYDGTPVYRYRYIGHPRTEIGLMAQDVEKHTPEAVQEFTGIKFVDYAKATERARNIAKEAA